MAYAAGVFHEWVKTCFLVYLTGRPEIMRELTIEELSRICFPTEGTDLVTLTVEDWLDFTSIKAVEDARLSTFSFIVNMY